MYYCQILPESNGSVLDVIVHFFLILRRPQFKLSGSECLAIIVKRDKA